MIVFRDELFCFFLMSIYLPEVQSCVQSESLHSLMIPWCRLHARIIMCVLKIRCQGHLSCVLHLVGWELRNHLCAWLYRSILDPIEARNEINSFIDLSDRIHFCRMIIQCQLNNILLKSNDIILLQKKSSLFFKLILGYNTLFFNHI